MVFACGDQNPDGQLRRGFCVSRCWPRAAGDYPHLNGLPNLFGPLPQQVEDSTDLVITSGLVWQIRRLGV